MVEGRDGKDGTKNGGDVFGDSHCGCAADTSCCGPAVDGVKEGVCGSVMDKMKGLCEGGCPVGDHKVAFMTGLTVLLAAFLVSQVGGVLGIIAFIRTL